MMRRGKYQPPKRFLFIVRTSDGETFLEGKTYKQARRLMTGRLAGILKFGRVLKWRERQDGSWSFKVVKRTGSTFLSGTISKGDEI